MTTREQLNLSQPLTDVYTAMETDLMTAIARQVAAGGEISATSEWRLKKLTEAGSLSKETAQIISSYTGIQSDLIAETIEGAAMSVADRLETALLACAKDGYISAVSGTPISEDIKNVVTGFRRQAKTDLNIVNTVMQSKANSAYKNLVNQIYDDTKRQELLGTSRQETVRNCIKEFSQKGIPAFVDKQGREWSTEAYINMDIRTAVNNTANAAQDACCDKYGLDLIQISSHMGARPKCAIDQGKLYSRSNRSGIAHDGDGNPITFYPWSSSSYGQPDGILGINCHHKKYPFVDGVNFQKYFPYEQEENAKRYEELQKQRAMERRVRETSRQADMLEAAGDTEGAKEARRKLREQRKDYREYSNEHGLSVHNDRLTVVKVRNGDTSYKNIYSSGLTNEKEHSIMKMGSDKVHLTIEKELEYGVKYAEDAINADMVYINSEEYAKKFKNITSNDAVNQAILECSRKAIEHRNGTLYEDMYLINGNTGEIVGSQTSSKEIQKVDYNESLNNAIIRAREEKFPLIALHNHPEGYPPSIDDFNSGCAHGYALGVVPGHNGQVYTFHSADKIIENTEDIHYDIAFAYKGGVDVDRAHREIYKIYGLDYNIE